MKLSREDYEGKRRDSLNWLNHKSMKNNKRVRYVVADKKPYGVHGLRVFSVHYTRDGANRELKRQYRQGSSTSTWYKLID